MATWDIDRMACKAYEAYGRKVSFKNYQGNPMPEYHDLPIPIKEAWHAIVIYLVANMTSVLEKEIASGKES